MTQQRIGFEKKATTGKTALEQSAQLEPHLLDLLADFSAGDPISAMGTKCAKALYGEICRVAKSAGAGEKATPVSPNTVRISGFSIGQFREVIFERIQNA
ncbi:hypothetical protein [Methylomicrobium lacus]|uniref:hypothetical protein n=1 Tax=Methylomicrobium lacus TaxID=136992 RepID=UPI0035A99C9D